MQLTVENRIVIQNKLFLAQDTMENIIVQRDIRNKIRLSEDEKVALNYQEIPVGGGRSELMWDMAKDIPKDVDLTSEEVVLLKSRVKALQEKAQIDEAGLGTYQCILGMK